MKFYADGRKDGDFDQGIEMVLARVLASPKFIYRIEAEPANAKLNEPYHIADLDLASRLSFFLWSSSPDDQLITLASQGRLKDPVVLERQVRRMLKDPRAEALAENFAGQWLNLRGLQSSGPLPMIYPDFDDPLRQAMRREVELLFDTIVREDRSVVESADRELHVRQRAPGQALRHPEHLRQPVPPRHARSRPGGTLGPDRQRGVPDDDLQARADVAGDARQMDHGQHPWDEPAESAARRAAAAAARGRCDRQCQRTNDARADAGASRARRTASSVTR